MINQTRHAPEYGRRIADLRERIAGAELAGVVLTSPERIYYLTGLDHLKYLSFAMLVVPRKGEPTVVTRSMRRPALRTQIPSCRHVALSNGAEPARAVSAALAPVVSAGGTVGIEDKAMFFPPELHNQITAALPDAGWQDASPLLTQAMAVKSDAEIDHMRIAARLSDAAMTAGLTTAGAGASEHTITNEIHHAMFARGGQQPGQTPFIRPLPVGDLSQDSWDGRRLEPGRGFFIELSGCFRRYHAPLSRTAFIGHAPPHAEEAHAIALAGLDAARDGLYPGSSTGEVYSRWRQAVTGSGTIEAPSRPHCGYLVGIGFPSSWVYGGAGPAIRSDNDTPVVAGMTFHLMSWVTGHVISDTALVTENGAELLTTAARDLIVVT